MKIGIITDSTADLDWDFASEKNIKVTPMKIMFHGESHDEDKEFDLNSYYENFSKEKLFKVSTSQPAPANFLDHLETLAKEGCEAIIVITVSSGLSGTYNSARLAADQFNLDFPNVKVEIVDSLSASAGEQLIVKEAIKLIEEKQEFDTIIQSLKNLVTRISTHLSLPTLKYLRAGGRISLPKFLIGNLLGLKPITHLDSSGKLVPVARVRSLDKGVEKLVELCTKDYTLTPSKFAISHANDIASSDLLVNKIKERYETIPIEVNVVGPVISAHTGIGGLALFGVFDEPYEKA